MTPNEITFWAIIAVTVAIEVFGGLVCWMYAKEVNECHK